MSGGGRHSPRFQPALPRSRAPCLWQTSCQGRGGSRPAPNGPAAALRGEGGTGHVKEILRKKTGEKKQSVGCFFVWLGFLTNSAVEVPQTTGVYVELI